MEVSGNVERVIGETVTLELTEGDDDFSGAVKLVGADGRTYGASSLSVKTQSSNTLSFVIPPDVAPGRAEARVARTGGAGTYRVPLRITRLAVALDAKGVLSFLPLAPATFVSSSQTVELGGGRLSLSPSGGMLAAVVGGKLKLQALGKAPRDLSAGLTLQGGSCLAALPDGVLMGSASEIKLLRVIKGKGVTQQGSYAVPGCKDIAVDDLGTRALVLHQCDADKDGQPEDCLTELSPGTSPTPGQPMVLDTKPSAVAVQLSANGRNAVVADGDALYGVALGSTVGGGVRVSKLSWGYAAKPVSVTRTSGTLPVSAGMVHLFAVAETTRNAVLFVGMDKQMLKWVFAGDQQLRVSLPAAPVSASFGRMVELYVMAGTTLYKVPNLLLNQTPANTGITISNTPVSFVVQP